MALQLKKKRTVEMSGLLTENNKRFSDRRSAGEERDRYNKTCKGWLKSGAPNQWQSVSDHSGCRNGKCESEKNKAFSKNVIPAGPKSDGTLTQDRFYSNRWEFRAAQTKASFLRTGFLRSRRKDSQGIIKKQKQKNLVDKSQSVWADFKHNPFH